MAIKGKVAIKIEEINQLIIISRLKDRHIIEDLIICRHQMRVLWITIQTNFEGNPEEEGGGIYRFKTKNIAQIHTKEEFPLIRTTREGNSLHLKSSLLFLRPTITNANTSKAREQTTSTPGTPTMITNSRKWEQVSFNNSLMYPTMQMPISKDLTIPHEAEVLWGAGVHIEEGSSNLEVSFSLEVEAEEEGDKIKTSSKIIIRLWVPNNDNRGSVNFKKWILKKEDKDTKAAINSKVWKSYLRKSKNSPKNHWKLKAKIGNNLKINRFQNKCQSICLNHKRNPIQRIKIQKDNNNILSKKGPRIIWMSRTTKETINTILNNRKIWSRPNKVTACVAKKNSITEWSCSLMPTKISLSRLRMGYGRW